MATASSIKLFLPVYLQGPNTNSFTFHYFFIRITAGRRRLCIIRLQKGGASHLISAVLFLDAMVPWRMEARLAETVWVALLGWVSSCLTVAGDVARALRSSDLSV